MRLLLDTSVFLWWIGDSPRLGGDARGLIADDDNEVYVSAASAWEIAIKRAQGKLGAGDVEAAIAENRFRPLAINVIHGTHAGGLPQHHRDPFDRMLVAQAQAEQMILVTADDVLERYDVEILRADR